MPATAASDVENSTPNVVWHAFVSLELKNHMGNVKLLFRHSRNELAELEMAQELFPVITSRCQAEKGDLIVGRYSVLPEYKQLEDDLAVHGARLINTYREHCWIADINYWYYDFLDLTPKTWFQVSDVPSGYPGSFVLKGATNSRKHRWDTHMFAKNTKDISRVHTALLDDSLFSHQGIYVREFEPFVTFGIGINGLPVTKEYRFFYLDGEPICGAYYWSEHEEDFETQAHAGIGEIPSAFLEDIGSRLKARFTVVDVAQHQDGRWRVVELNDGQMSGTSCISPHLLYAQLHRYLCPESYP